MKNHSLDKPEQVTGSKDWIKRETFQPLPLLSNCHLQTLLGYVLPGPRLVEPPHEHVILLPDGDALVLHENRPLSWKEGDGMALLLHGLAGSANSSQMHRIGYHLLNRGLRVFRLDMRGAGKGLHLARQVYHAGRSEDVRIALDTIHRMAPSSDVILAGVSLGGAVALRVAAESSTQQPIPYLSKVAALGPPIDLEGCAELMAHPKNRFYERFFLRDLMATARKRQEIFADLPPLRFPKRMTIRLFDELYTAPRSGFYDAADYYRNATVVNLVEKIKIPALLITARDDPFILVDPFEKKTYPDNITIRIYDHGGHIGFLGWDGTGDLRWVEKRIADWITGKPA